MLLLSGLFPWWLFAPREPIRTIDWSRENVCDYRGLPYDDFANPQQSAPGGPLDALDCREILELWLQWATRLGKSFVGQVGAMKHADREPCPMMYAGPHAELAGQMVEKLYAMIERCPPLAGQLPKNKNRRSRTLVRLAYCLIHVAWSRSPTTLGDKSVRYGHAFEIDKWEHTKTSKEADPLQLWDERFKEFVTYKRVKEGSPALKGSSRVERGRLSGHNCRLEVPCPHCDHFQVLRLGNGKQPGGIAWEHDAAGRSDATIAGRTARYICEECQEPIGDEHRGSMMRSGVWIPEGCGCDPDKAHQAVERSRQPGQALWRGWRHSEWITGEPLRDGPIYSSQLSSLYALSLSWGDIAAKFVSTRRYPHELRNFVNGWLGETWALAKHDEDWESLGKRLLLGPDVGRGIVPRGYGHLAAGIDKQVEPGTHYPLVVVSWGAQGEAHVVDYADLPSDEALLAFLDREFPGADGQRHRIGLSLFDSGSRPHGVHDLIDRARKRGLAILPCKGSSTALGVPYVKKRLGENTTRPGAPHVLVDTITTQDWIEKRLHDEQERGRTSIFRASLEEHRDFLEQLLNDAPVQESDTHNKTRESWQRLDQSIPNDCRDALRYAFIAWLLRNRGKESQSAAGGASPPAGQASAKKRKPSRSSPLHRPGGWLSQLP